MSDFIPPRMEHVIIDEESQMQKYLAEIAMEDILLAGGKRTERPSGLMARYKRSVAAEHAAGGPGIAAVEEIDGGVSIGTGVVVTRAMIVEITAEDED